MREYNYRQLNNKRLQDEHTQEIYERIPRIREINDAMASLSVAMGKKLLFDAPDNKTALINDLKEQLAKLSNEKSYLLEDNGYPKDYLDMHYTCEHCRDTGYIDNRRCRCLEQKIIESLYEMSNIKQILKEENFSNFKYELFSDNAIDTATGKTPAQNIHSIIKICLDFIKNFDTNFENLFFYGETGVGKTFITNCIAKELIDRSYSVVYCSAIRLFDIFADSTFHRDTESVNLDKHLLDCDLLIIDDLGTEMVNTFTNTALFECINERYLRRKSTIISTNYSISDLKNNYSERTFSRITSNYTLLKIYGEDLRIYNKLTPNKP